MEICEDGFTSLMMWVNHTGIKILTGVDYRMGHEAFLLAEGQVIFCYIL